MSGLERLVCLMVVYCVLAVCAPCLMTMAFGSAEAGMAAARVAAAVGAAALAALAVREIRGGEDGR